MKDEIRDKILNLLKQHRIYDHRHAQTRWLPQATTVGYANDFAENLAPLNNAVVQHQEAFSRRMMSADSFAISTAVSTQTSTSATLSEDCD